MKVIKLFIYCITLLATFFLCSCSSKQSLEPYDHVANNFLPRQDNFVIENYTAVITREQALQDYEYMWSFFEDNLPYYSDLDEVLALSGESLETIMEDGRKSIEFWYSLSKNKGLALRKYADVFKSVIDDLKYYGHIQVLDDLFTVNVIQNEYRYRISENDALSTTALYDIVSNDKTVSFYQRIGNSSSGTIANFESPEARSRFIEDSFDRNFTLNYVDDIPYVVIRSFNDPFNDSNDYVDYTSARLGDFFMENKDADNLIIDVRGNGGGNALLWMNGIIPYLTSEPLSVYYVSGINMTDYTNFLFEGDVIELAKVPFTEYVMPNIGEDWQTSLPGISDSILDRFDKIYVRKAYYPVSEKHVGFHGRIWLLADDNCYSAASNFIYLSKHTGFATTVGSNVRSSGVTAFAKAWSFALPNSGMLIYYDSSYGFNDNGTCTAIYGTIPDIAVEGDALEACLQEIAILK